MQLILFGAPGVGKGTQAKILSSTRELKHISTGDILRAEISKGSELGKKAKGLMDKGELVPDELIIGVVKNLMKEAIAKNGFILDGFPRTVNQAKLLQEICAELNIDVPPIVILKANDEVIVNRLSQRRQCAKCGTIVNQSDLVDRETCPTCKEKDKFIIREDDKEEVILNRLRVYRENTRPVVKYLEDTVPVHRIDAIQSVDVVTQSIMWALTGKQL
jgi:adenylate kinase